MYTQVLIGLLVSINPSFKLVAPILVSDEKNIVSPQRYLKQYPSTNCTDTNFSKQKTMAQTPHTQTCFWLLLITLCLYLPACKPQTNNAPTPPRAVIDSLEPLLHTLPIKKPMVEKMPDTTTSVAFDTLLHYYKETYKVTLLKNELWWYTRKGDNALLTITRQSNKKQVVRDSLYSQWDDVRFEDYNDDGYKDIIVYNYSGARGSNSYYTLYATDVKNKTFRQIMGFDYVVAPQIDSNRIIISTGLTNSSAEYDFYKLSNYKLIKLNKATTGYPLSDDDSITSKAFHDYTKAYAKALKLAKKYK